jgi:hypothetical protein
MNRRLLTLLAVPAALAIPGHASANANSADADCSGVTFTMPRGETDTVVTTTLDGRVVRTDVIATFGASLAFSIPSPDQTRTHVWAITVDSRWNTDTAWTEVVPACVAPTTVPTAAPSSTVLGVPPSTPPVVQTTVVAVTTPPVAPTTVVTTPRTPATTTTVPVGPYRLPDTGSSSTLALMALAATAFVLFGIHLKHWGRK